MTEPMTPERLAEVEARVGCPFATQAVRIGEVEACARAVVEHDAPALLAEVRRLQAAVERVRELHQDEGQSQGYFPDDRGYGVRDHCCGTCGSHGEYGVEWPCPTIAALDGDER